MEVIIHASTTVGWHREGAARFSEGLSALGVPHRVVSERHRVSAGLPILLGTNAFRAVEDGGPYLLVDRCSFGDTDRWVSLVRDGHGRRGDHRVPEHVTPARWEWIERGGAARLEPWHTGRRVVLCGQHESWSPQWPSLDSWYARVSDACTHFRRHPHGTPHPALPEQRSWRDVGRAVTLNSSVGVAAVLQGVPTVTMDEAAMAWDVTAHDPQESLKPPRLPWLAWLAWTQWNWDEIREGRPWEHLL